MERKKRCIFLSPKTSSNSSCSSPSYKETPIQTTLACHPFEYLSEKIVEEWKENRKHEKRKGIEG
jgi:hypothetical protein